MNDQFEFGALFSKPDVRDYTAHTELTTFPDEFELDMPGVKNQMNINSCVANALATIVEYFNEKETGEYVEMSVGYIYGNRRLTIHKGKGLFTRDTIRTVAKYGDVPNVYFPNNTEAPRIVEEFEDKVDCIEATGYRFKFAEYFKLKDASAIKASLMENGPVIFAMTWFDDIRVVNGVMQTNKKRSKLITGGHCMVIYGWNEIGWKVRNSWGALWGDRGNVVIPYDVPIREVWGIKDATVDSSLILKRPFNTKTSENIAKLLNFVIIGVYNLLYKFIKKA
jgi:C1A family cysteine protease